jgi:hypothetical protein
MDWKDLGSEVAKIGLPLLGAVLPIPGGAAIGTALASALGSGSTDPQDVLTALTASADAQLKARQFEQAHQETMMQMQLRYETDLYQAEVADRSSARAMQVSTKSYTLPVLAWLFVMGFCVITILKLTGVGIPADGTASDLITTLRDGLMLILSFYFGSSHESQGKDVLLANSTPPVVR